MSSLHHCQLQMPQAATAVFAQHDSGLQEVQQVLSG